MYIDINLFRRQVQKQDASRGLPLHEESLQPFDNRMPYHSVLDRAVINEYPQTATT